MQIIITILLVLAAIIVLLLIVGLVMRKAYNVKRDIIINAPQQKVFDYLRHLKNQDNFNKWVMTDPNMKKEFKGVDGTVGFVYAWDGNKRAGAGEQQITALVEGNSIQTEIRFIRPFAGIAQANTIIEFVSDNQTKITWNNESKMMYPMNIMISMIEKMLAKDMDESLGNLKRVLEG